MNPQTHLHSTYRTKFKQMISSQRYNNTEKTFSPSLNMSLSQLSYRSREKEENKKIHTLSKQTFITNKKLFLLNRKTFYQKENNKSKSGITKTNRQYTAPLHDELMSSKLITQTQVFNISQEIMKNPFTFHRNMIIKVKDDKGTKNILNKWYSSSVSDNIQKFKKIQNEEKKKSQYGNKSSSHLDKVRKQNTNNKQFLKGSQVKHSSCPKINEEALNKYSGCSTNFSRNNETQKLTKLIVRLQPFWYKVRIKV